MTVSFNNIPSNMRVPLFWAEMDNSMANSATSTLRRLIIGQVNDDVVLPDTLLQIAASESVVTALAGDGSMLSAMYISLRKVDPMGEVYVLPVNVTAGSTAAGSITFTGSATEAGVFSLYIGNTRIRVSVTAGESAAECAAALIDAVNATTGLPVIAADATADGVVKITLTCKWKGDTGNDIRVAFNLGGAASNEKTPAGLTTVVVNPSGGTGSPDITAALSALGDEAFEFIINPYTDATSLDAFKEFMNDATGRWSYIQQLYGHVYSAMRGTLGQAVALGRLRNDQHMTIPAFEMQVPNSIWESAASYAGKIAVFISADPARPTQTGQLIGLSPAPAGQRFYTLERQSLLNNGIATQTYDGSYLVIERAITTYQKNSYGQSDNSYLDSETMHQSAYVLRDLKTTVTSKYGRHKLADDGTRAGPGSAIVTPSMIRAEIIARYYALEKLGIVENADLFAKYLIVERSKTDNDRVDILYPPDYVNQLRIVGLVNQFRLQYPEAA